MTQTIVTIYDGPAYEDSIHIRIEHDGDKKERYVVEYAYDMLGDVISTTDSSTTAPFTPLANALAFSYLHA